MIFDIISLIIFDYGKFNYYIGLFIKEINMANPNLIRQIEYYLS